MTIALVLGGGAPNLTLMAGAVAALDDAGVEFDIVSTSGAMTWSELKRLSHSDGRIIYLPKARRPPTRRKHWSGRASPVSVR